MEDILFELYIAEAVVKNHSSDFDSDSIQSQALFHSILDKYHISEQIFNTSLVWYNIHLEKFITINKQLITKYALTIENLKEK